MRIIDLFSGVGGLTFGFYYRKYKDHLSGIEKINSFLQMNTIRLQLKHTLKIILIFL